MSTEIIREAKDAAQIAFWEKFAEYFPNVTSGDLEPLALVEFEKAIDTITDIWLRNDLQRIHSNLHPSGVTWIDGYKIEGNEYKKLAFLNSQTLILEFETDCPLEFRDFILENAKVLQDKHGQKYFIKNSGELIAVI